jgi:MoaA/NifB/PqqE/SkfB family radical SAM enzyme
VSIDGVGEVAERVRGGTKWNKVLQFVDYVYEAGYELQFNTVLHKNNHFDIKNIAEYVKQYDPNWYNWYINVLTYPEHLDIKNLEKTEQLSLIDVALFEDLPNKDFITNHLETN